MRHGTRPWALLAVISMIALLFGFERAVHRVVDQGNDRRAAERELYSATWRCKLLPTQQDRADCSAALR
jgi:hypothetical protein